MNIEEYMKTELTNKLLSTPMKLLLIIGLLYEENKEWPGVSEIYSQINRNTHVWYNWQDFFLQQGLIEIKETKSSVGSAKKVVVLTDKGKKIYENLKYCLDRLILIENEK
ncbi:hypothetical protein [Sulfurisphaera ohwakuensis]|uniref:hypothetical protein n=1 Tax=Sulfurisphaera ohwakuensis TaxID=69656 RepID=UPI0036F29F15